MKIDRRCFLSFGIGAAAGIGLSPLPLKLTDDSSIWSQTWPWTPVPANGAVTYENTVCTLCPMGGCGIAVRKVDERAVKVEGMNGYPGNNGKACPLGMSGVQLLYGPTAIKAPMKKTENGFKEISWDEALSEVATKLGELKDADSLACIADSDCGTTPALFKRFLAAFGSPNFMRSPSLEDSYEMTLKLMHGADASIAIDLENSDFILSFGSGVLEGWGVPGRMFQAHSQWRDKGAKLVQVEPRLSNTAAKATEHIFVNPGTEGLLALGMANVLISEGLYDQAFAAAASGFEELKTIILDNFSPSQVSGKTGVSSSTIKDLAKAFAAASAPVALAGKGQGRTSGAVHEFLAVHTLNALAGNINKKGGVCAVKRDAYITWPEVTPASSKRVDGAGSEKYPYAKYLTDRLAGVINAAEESPVQALFVYEANPLYTLPDTEAVKKAFEKIPFIVSFASHMNETAEVADIILPTPSHLERLEDVPAPFGMNQAMVGLAKPVVKKQNNTQNAGDTLIALAKKMGGDVAAALPWANYEACLKDTLAAHWKALNADGFVVGAITPVPFADNQFKFMSAACGHGKDGEKVSPVDGDESLPLTLISYDSLRLANGPVADTPFLMKIVPDTEIKGKDAWVEINSKTGGKCGLAEGVCAKLITAKGEFKVRVHFNDGLMPGLVAMASGLGHTTSCDEYMSGKGINVNQLIGPIEDPASGLNMAVGTRAKLVIA